MSNHIKRCGLNQALKVKTPPGPGLFVALLASVMLLPFGARAATGDPDSFNTGADYIVNAAVAQPDGTQSPQLN